MVFTTSNIKYAKLVKQSIQKINSKVIQNNKAVALNDWDWKIIGENLKNVFSDLEILNQFIENYLVGKCENYLKFLRNLLISLKHFFNKLFNLKKIIKNIFFIE